MTNTQVITLMFFFLIVNFLFWFSRNRKRERLEREGNERRESMNFIRGEVKRLQYENDERVRQDQIVETAFLLSVKEAKDDNEILKLLQKRLLKLLEVRWEYHSTHSSSNDELYNESCVMPDVIDDLKRYASKTDLVNYCALVLDRFDKDRSYNYGLRNEKIYKLRYIYGSVQSIIEHEIEEIENYKPGFLTEVYTQKERFETDFRKQYVQEKRKR